MQIKSSVYKSLFAVTRKNKLVQIPNKLMRKLKWKEEQDSFLSPNSVCIVCNFSFQYKNRGWSKKIKAICHPFRDTNIFPKDKKVILFSESDYCDVLWMPEISKCDPNRKKEYEFFAFTIDKDQGLKCKGLHTLSLAAQIAEERGNKGLILDYFDGRNTHYKRAEHGSLGWQVEESRKELYRFKNIDIIRGVHNQENISKLMSKCKYVIFPNTRDASPRIIPETLLRGKPVLVNSGILGGWKYVTDTNGMFFDGPFDWLELNKNRNMYYENLKKFMSIMFQKTFDHNEIRNEYLDTYGFRRTAKRMANIINDIEGSPKYKLVAYKEFGKILNKFC